MRYKHSNMSYMRRCSKWPSLWTCSVVFYDSDRIASGFKIASNSFALLCCEFIWWINIFTCPQRKEWSGSRWGSPGDHVCAIHNQTRNLRNTKSDVKKCRGGPSCSHEGKSINRKCSSLYRNILSHVGVVAWLIRRVLCWLIGWIAPYTFTQLGTAGNTVLSPIYTLYTVHCYTLGFSGFTSCVLSMDLSQ
jgi:hypothetical protein